MIVADLLKRQLFPDFALLGGSAGLNRTLLSVSVIDSPDVDRWMRGGELLVGSGYIFRENPLDLIPFMERAHSKGVVAIGIKLDRYHHDLTDEIRSCADRLGFPLIQIPLNYRWTDIIEISYAFMTQEKQSLSMNLQNTGDFWEQGIDPKRLLSDMACKLERPIIAVSPFLELNHVFSPDGGVDGGSQVQDFMANTVVKETGLPRRGQIMAHLELRNRPEPQWAVVFRTIQDTPMTLYLCLIEGEHFPSSRQIRLVLRGITLLRTAALETETFTPKSEVRSQRFFEGLCLDTYNDSDMIRANLADLNIVLPSMSRVVTVIPSDNGNALRWMPQNAALSYTLGNSWTGLISLDDGSESISLLGEMAESKQLLIAIGQIVRNAQEISRSFQGARRTLNWVRSFSLPPGAYLQEELSLFALLESLSRFPEARDVWKYYWEPLILEKNRTRRSLALADLARALVAADFNVRLCSEQLHLHYNTVRNYAKEIEDLLDLDLGNAHHRLGLTLASHINRSIKKE